MTDDQPDPLDPAAEAAIWAEFDQDVAAGRDALDSVVQHLRVALDLGLGTPERLIAGLTITLGGLRPETAQALAAMAVVRLAEQHPPVVAVVRVPR